MYCTRNTLRGGYSCTHLILNSQAIPTFLRSLLGISMICLMDYPSASVANAADSAKPYSTIEMNWNTVQIDGYGHMISKYRHVARLR